MSDDIKELVKRLRAPAYWMSGSGEGHEGESDIPLKAADALEALVAERDSLRAALVRLRDCDWVIRLPDRMDGVRQIAREALEDKE